HAVLHQAATEAALRSGFAEEAMLILLGDRDDDNLAECACRLRPNTNASCSFRILLADLSGQCVVDDQLRIGDALGSRCRPQLRGHLSGRARPSAVLISPAHSSRKSPTWRGAEANFSTK